MSFPIICAAFIVSVVGTAGLQWIVVVGERISFDL